VNDTKNSFIPNKSTKGDLALGAGKILASFIPYAGGPLVELMNMAILPPLEKKEDSMA